MNRRERGRVAKALAALALALLAFVALAEGLFYWGLPLADRAQWADQAGQRWAWQLLCLLGFVAACAAPVARWVRRYDTVPAQLLDRTRLSLAHAGPAPESSPVPSPWTELAESITALVAQREALRAGMDQRIAQSQVEWQAEKSRLVALLSELNLSVLVCSLDGRIVLYNRRAVWQCRALSPTPQWSAGAEWVGVGRSVYALFDRSQIAHALDNLRQRLQRGATAPVATFASRTPSGQLLKVQVAPVRDAEAPVAASPVEGYGADFSGFVLTLENLTQSFEADNRRDQALVQAVEQSLADLQAGFNGLPAEPVNRLRALAQEARERIKTRWPLETMAADDLLALAGRQLDRPECPVEAEPAPRDLCVRADSYGLLQAMAFLAQRLVDEFQIRFLRLRLEAVADRVCLDMVWSGHAMSMETVMGWRMDSMVTPGHGAASSDPVGQTLSVNDVLVRHGAELEFARERTRHEAYFRISLPLVPPVQEEPVATAVTQPSRPEFYDFDLFQSTPESRALEDQPLAGLAYTVFDTETTGLNPTGGDKIIQIGAVRVVNGKLRRSECYEQLIDPERSIPEATIPIHGITPAMVAGKPRMAQVLPVFHAFARDTVLVAHNAAFDMRFLQLQEKATGCVFHQPVLDTLLLSAALHPNQDSHRLEALAERFGVTVLGRHTALGDAMVTAEVFVRLLPLLQAAGIHTLGQARTAAAQTHYAKLRY